ncbi:UNVERIFIED_CONTAM: KH domain-containing protein [Sesamum calycinum]|uniref:KH domain-containing protein n=1 Tax=Sesamum calycinum TaxID=2727403 RepID=A0AAW2Q7I8_9LAMI
MAIVSSALPVVSGYGGASRTEELFIKVLCPSNKIGRVIGKGGSSIKSIRQDSGARVEVEDRKSNHNECVITVISTESSDDLKSMAVEAVLLLQAKINDDDDDTVTMRLLVPSKVIGCIIGKSGSIINEIRKRTKADIRISKGEKPKCANENDELVEIFGQVGSVRDALIQIVLRLRDDVLKIEKTSVILLLVLSHYTPVVLLFQCHQFCAVCHLVLLWVMIKGWILEVGWDYFLPVDMDMGPYRHAYLKMEKKPMKIDDYANLLVRIPFLVFNKLTAMGDNGYGSLSSHSSSLYAGLPPPSTLEMVIPAHAVGKVMGKGGTNIDNIRKISGAAVEISDSKSSRGDRVALISGTTEQKRAAENLIQAFIMAT